MNKILDFSAAFGLYDWWANRNLREIHGTIIDLADLQDNEGVLDVGCGTGLLSLRLARSSKDIIVKGLDVGQHMIAVARRRLREYKLKIKCDIGTSMKLPYTHGQFDVVLSCLVFHLLWDLEKELTLREIYRVLKPGGRYVCAEFEQYPVDFFCNVLSGYPKDLIGTAGFDIEKEYTGPSLTKCHSITYRVLRKSKTEA